MHDKSYVTLEQHVCVVCGVAFDTGALLLDKRLRERFERHTATGWGLCAEHRKLADDGYIALVECDPERSRLWAGGDRANPAEVVRTGRFAHVKREAFPLVFNAPAPEKPCAFVVPDVIDKLRAMAALR